MSSATQRLYLQGPPQLEESTRPNLDKSLADLLGAGDDVTVTDSALPFNLTLRISLD